MINNETVCLFYGAINTCLNRCDKSDEHVIQKGVGGTLHTRDLVCSKCNEALGVDIDSAFSDLYRNIFNAMGPLLAGQLKTKAIPARTSSGQHALITSGGVVGLAKISEIVDKDGTTTGLIGPLAQTENLEKKARDMGRTYQYTEEPMNVTLPETVLIAHKFYDNELHPRAALKSLLESIAYFQEKKFLQNLTPNISRSEDARPAISFIATGATSYRFGKNTAYFMDIGPELRDFFGTTDDEIYNRIAISCDKESKTVWGFLQIAEAMPWAFRIFDHIEIVASETMLYEQCLTSRHIKPTISTTAKVFLSKAQLDSRRFVTSTSGAISFALTRFFESQKISHGLALVLTERRHDDVIMDSISVQMKYHISNGVAEANAFARAVSTMLSIRYVGKMNSKSPYWQTIENYAACELTSASFIFPSHENGLPAFDSSMKSTLLGIYRKQLDAVINAHGLPDFYTELDNSSPKFLTFYRIGNKYQAAGR